MPWTPNFAASEACWFINGDDEELDLTTTTDDDAETEQYKQGIDGRFMPPIAHQIDETPGMDGGWYRGTTAGLPAITVPLLLTADNITDLRDRHRVLAQGVNPIAGPGRLYVETVDGYARSMPAIYESGFEKDPATNGEIYEQMVNLTFRGLSSYWEDNDSSGRALTKQPTSGTFFPAPPFRAGQSSIFAQWTETNEGDVPVYPVWTITGPGEELALMNATTREEFRVNVVLRESEGLVIDTRRSRLTVQTSGDIDLFPESDGDLWGLRKGPNVLSAQLRSVGESTRVQLEYWPQFLGV